MGIKRKENEPPLEIEIRGLRYNHVGISAFNSVRPLIFCILPMFFISFYSFAQSLTDFSGKWILDNARSSSLYSGLASVLVIAQTGNVINIETILIQGDTEPINLSEKFTLGTTIQRKDTTLITSWSSDKQSFSILEVKKDTKNLKIYSLKQGGKMLYVKSDETLPEGFIRHTIMVYNKALDKK
jgi:hypothetical protein